MNQNDETELFETRIIGYFDVLGFKAFSKNVERDKLKKLLLTIKDANIALIDERLSLEDSRIKKGDPNFFQNNILIMEKGELKAIHQMVPEVFGGADNFILSMKVKQGNDKSPSLVHQLSIIHEYVCKLYGTLLFEYGLMLRGAVTFGQAYHNESIISGDPYFEAVELEKEICIYPRIILGGSLLLELLSKKINSTLFSFFFRKDIDGNYFIRLFMSSSQTANFEYHKAIELEKIIIKQLENDCNKDLKIRSKWQWLLSYVNGEKETLGLIK